MASGNKNILGGLSEKSIISITSGREAFPLLGEIQRGSLLTKYPSVSPLKGEKPTLRIVTSPQKLCKPFFPARLKFQENRYLAESFQC